MTAPAAAPERRVRSRRLLLIVGAAVVLLAVAAAIVVVLVTRPATGIAAAMKDGGFSSCLDLGGAAQPEGTDSWDHEDEAAFWSQPVALDCASRNLADDDRQRALAVAFPSLEGSEGGDVQDQWQPILDYVTWLHENEEPRDLVVLRVASILETLWVADAEHGNWADGFVNSAILMDMQLRDELPGYDAWSADLEEEEPQIDALFQYREDVLSKVGEETESAYHEYSERSRALYDVVR